MRCQGCGKKLKKNVEFCTECGFYNEPKDLSLENDLKDSKEMEEDIELLDDSEVYEDFVDLDDNIDNDDNDKDSYLETFIGEDYHWIRKSIINPFAFILSFMYFIYRKLYLIGMIGLILTGFVIKLYPKYLLYYALIVMFLSSLLFNPIYLMIAKKRILKLKRRVDEDELDDACRRRGGTNLIGALFIFFIFVVIMLFTYIHIDFGEDKPSFWEENNENNANCMLVSKEAFEIVKKQNSSVTLDSAVCSIRVSNKKYHDIYLKVFVDVGEYDYYYLKNDGKYLIIEGDTTKISELEKESNLLKEEEEMLIVSKSLPEKYEKLKELSDSEEDEITRRVNTSQRLTYFYLENELYK